MLCFYHTFTFCIFTFYNYIYIYVCYFEYMFISYAFRSYIIYMLCFSIIHSYVTHASWIGFPLHNIWVTDDHSHVSFVVVEMLSFPRSLFIIGFCKISKTTMSLVDQEIVRTIPEQLSSLPVFILFSIISDRCRV